MRQESITMNTTNTTAAVVATVPTQASLLMSSYTNNDTTITARGTVSALVAAVKGTIIETVVLTTRTLESVPGTIRIVRIGGESLVEATRRAMLRLSAEDFKQHIRTVQELPANARDSYLKDMYSISINEWKETVKSILADA
jgi:hypothetical protein